MRPCSCRLCEVLPGQSSRSRHCLIRVTQAISLTVATTVFQYVLLSTFCNDQRIPDAVAIVSLDSSGPSVHVQAHPCQGLIGQSLFVFMSNDHDASSGSFVISAFFSAKASNTAYLAEECTLHHLW